MIFNDVLKIVKEQIKKNGFDGAVLFNNGIVTFDDRGGNFNIGVHLGGFHDKMNIESDSRIHNDVEGYLSDEWIEGDEERIAYKDKIVIFGIDNIEIYPYENKLQEELEI
jgi:hypothetical protein